MISRSEFLTIALSALALTACGPGAHDAGHPAGHDDSTSISSHMAARQMMKAGADAGSYIAMQERAVAELREGVAKDDPVDILSQAGYFHCRVGDYDQGLLYLQEASDSLMARGDSVDARAAITTVGNLANLYCRFGLYDDALRENRRAIGISLSSGGPLLTDLYRMRAVPFDRMAMPDSVLRCYDMALRAADDYPLSVPREQIVDGILSDKATYFIENHDMFADSVDWAIGQLERNLSRDSQLSDTEKLILGRGYVIRGRAARGLPLMEQALAAFREQQWEESEQWAMKLLALSYAESGQGGKLAAIYPGLAALNDTIMGRDKINATIAADFRYRVRRSEEEALLQAARAEALHSEVIWQRIAIGCGTLLLACVIGLAWVSVRRKNRKIRIGQQQIDAILLHQQDMNARIESLNDALVRKESSETLDNVARTLNPLVLSKEDEITFRRSFAALHPRYLPDLRREYDSLTPNDELVCMLIYLKFNSDEIALSLGITKMSVNSARHRIRKKLGLAKDVDLDLWLCARKG